MPKSTLTTSNGAPVPQEGLTSSATAGKQGPILLQDFVLLDHMAHFSRERIPERVVHAKGVGAFGHFEVTNTEITKYCKAKLFSQVGKRTPIAVRFSFVSGESGAADTVRDPRGFAVKFYTEEGNWDLVGNNTPIFFLRDPMLFPSFIHTQKRNAATNLKDPNAVWDFASLRPETAHQMSFLFSDRGIPDGYRFMNGYGSHTFANINDAGELAYVKYHYKSDQGVRNLAPEKAKKIAGEDPDYATRDLYEAIARKEFPTWTLSIQVMTPEQAEKSEMNPFDVTKVWPHAEYPLIEVGKLVLNRNPENYFAEVEQLAFAPSHFIPGITTSPDKMLQGRLFSYVDAHFYRLGINYQQLPVNRPLSDVRTYQRDGLMNTGKNMGGLPNYFPNSVGGAPKESKDEKFVAYAGDHKVVDKFSTKDDDNFMQARHFYRKVLDEDARDRLTSNLAENLAKATKPVQERTIEMFAQVDPDYGQRIREKMADDDALSDDMAKVSVIEGTLKTAPIKNGPSVLMEMLPHNSKAYSANVATSLGVDCGLAPETASPIVDDPPEEHPTTARRAHARTRRRSRIAASTHFLTSLDGALQGFFQIDFSEDAIGELGGFLLDDRKTPSVWIKDSWSVLIDQEIAHASASAASTSTLWSTSKSETSQPTTATALPKWSR